MNSESAGGQQAGDQSRPTKLTKHESTLHGQNQYLQKLLEKLQAEAAVREKELLKAVEEQGRENGKFLVANANLTHEHSVGRLRRLFELGPTLLGLVGSCFVSTAEWWRLGWGLVIVATVLYVCMLVWYAIEFSMAHPKSN